MTTALTGLLPGGPVPLLVGLAFEGLENVTSIETENFTFAIAVFGAFVLCNVLNFALIAVAMAVYLGIPFGREIRTVYVPVVPSELASGLLAASVAVLYREWDSETVR